MKRKASAKRRFVAEQTGMIRVIDESGEDYLYPTGYFAAVDLPESVEEAVLQASV